MEIDLDIEWDADGRVHLWEFLVSTPDNGPAYHPVVTWEPMITQRETELAVTACA